MLFEVGTPLVAGSLSEAMTTFGRTTANISFVFASANFGFYFLRFLFTRLCLGGVPYRHTGLDFDPTERAPVHSIRKVFPFNPAKPLCDALGKAKLQLKATKRKTKTEYSKLPSSSAISSEMVVFAADVVHKQMRKIRT